MTWTITINITQHNRYSQTIGPIRDQLKPETDTHRLHVSYTSACRWKALVHIGLRITCQCVTRQWQALVTTVGHDAYSHCHRLHYTVTEYTSYQRWQALNGPYDQTRLVTINNCYEEYTNHNEYVTMFIHVRLHFSLSEEKLRLVDDTTMTDVVGTCHSVDSCSQQDLTTKHQCGYEQLLWVNPFTPTVAIRVQLWSILCHTVICNSWHPGTLTLSPERQSVPRCQELQMTA